MAYEDIKQRHFDEWKEKEAEADRQAAQRVQTARGYFDGWMQGLVEGKAAEFLYRVSSAADRKKLQPVVFNSGHDGAGSGWDDKNQWDKDPMQGLIKLKELCREKNVHLQLYADYHDYLCAVIDPCRPYGDVAISRPRDIFWGLVENAVDIATHKSCLQYMTEEEKKGFKQLTLKSLNCRFNDIAHESSYFYKGARKLAGYNPLALTLAQEDIEGLKGYQALKKSCEKAGKPFRFDVKTGSISFNKKFGLF